MSKLIVEICEIAEVLPMENSDFLEKITIKGWNVVVQKALNLKPGDLVVFFPPDSVLTEELADKLEIRKYLSPVPFKSETRYRVRAARLRNVSSYGTIDHEVPPGCKIGDDVTKLYGVTKWDPPVGNEPNQIKPHSNFHRYTEIENIRNYKDAFEPGEMVVVTEKLHGKSGRVGRLRDNTPVKKSFLKWLWNLWVKAEDPIKYAFMAGSYNAQFAIRDPGGNFTTFAHPIDNGDVVKMLNDLSQDKHDVIMFYELIGSGVQDMVYGYENGTKSFRAFDLMIDGRYVDSDVKLELFTYYNIPSVPILYQGDFSWDVINNLTDGRTTMCDAKFAGPFKGREGIVVTALTSPAQYCNRKIFKDVSADYLARKNGTDGH